MDNSSRRILLFVTGFLCVLTQAFGGLVSLGHSGDNGQVLTIDQLLVNASKTAEASQPSPFYFSEQTHLIRKELDMVFSLQEWMELKQTHRQRRTAAIRPTWYERRWTNNVVNYQLETGTFDWRDKLEIEKAMREISHYTCLRFKETKSAYDRVQIQNGMGGCYSRVGMVGGAQALGLGQGCRMKRIIIHELMHAIGVHHEQTRPDRDDHVTIRLDRVTKGVENNFEKYDWNYINNHSLPYDYTSVMHYGPTSFSTTGENTIVTKDPAYQNVIGTNPGLSSSDIRTLNSMHGCVPASCPLKDSECGRGGWVGKDCKCWCKGPTSSHPAEYCFDEDKDAMGSLDFSYMCQDFHPDCARAAADGYCDKHPDLMQYHCEHTCQFC